MPDNRIHVIKNRLNKACKICGGHHEYISKQSEHARCGTPVGMPKDMAVDIAKGLGYTEDDVILAPDNIVVVLDPRARKLKQQAGQTVPLEQVPMQPRPM
jgi:hypothetical protein